jgi:hypothetical protein
MVRAASNKTVIPGQQTFSAPQQQTNQSLHPTHPRDHVALSDYTIAGDIFQRRTAAQRHGDLELIPQHPQCVPHPSLAVDSKGEQYGPSNLTEDKMNA